MAKSPNTSDVASEPLTLQSLAQLSIEERFQYLIDQARSNFESVTTRSRCFPIMADKSAFQRLVWAVAFNVVGQDRELNGAIEPSQIETRCYLTAWPAQTDFAEFIAELSKANEDFCRLAELALSVGCEQRQDWQHPDCRPINRETADAYFRFVYAGAAKKVEAYLERSFGNRAGDPDALANEAWARVFQCYWSSGAQRRFLGLGRISTLVCQVGRHIVLDALRAAKRDQPVSLDALTGAEDGLAAQFGVTIDPAAGMSAGDLRQTVEQAIAQLTARAAVIAEMVWLRGLTAREVAAKLKISESAVSQQLSKAKEAARNLLSEKGFQLPA